MNNFKNEDYFKNLKGEKLLEKHCVPSNLTTNCQIGMDLRKDKNSNQITGKSAMVTIKFKK